MSIDHKDNAWPTDWPVYHNACTDPCDMREGPCACGAWHQANEFELQNDGLYRYGKKVAEK